MSGRASFCVRPSPDPQPAFPAVAPLARTSPRRSPGSCRTGQWGRAFLRGSGGAVFSAAACPPELQAWRCAAIATGRWSPAVMKAGRRGPRAHFACRPWLVALLLSSGVGAAPDEARRFSRARGGPWAPCGSSCGLRVAGGGEMWLPIQRAALPKPPSRGWDAGRRVAGVSRSPSEVLSPRGMRGDGCLAC